jgi:hypothetical protein
MVFVLVEMWERFLWNVGYSCHLWQIRFGLSDRDANLKYGAIQASVYAFTL